MKIKYLGIVITVLTITHLTGCGTTKPKRLDFYAYIEKGAGDITLKRGYDPNVEWRLKKDGVVALPFIKETDNLLVAVDHVRGTQWIVEHPPIKDGYGIVPFIEISAFPNEYRAAVSKHNTANDKHQIVLFVRYPERMVGLMAPPTEIAKERVH